MKFSVDDAVRIVSTKNMFFGCTGLITDVHNGDLLPGEIHYRVNLVIPGCQLAQGIEVDGATLMIPVVVREFEIERAN